MSETQKFNVWIDKEVHIPDFAKLLGIDEAILRKRFKDAEEAEMLCIFPVDLTAAQLQAVRVRMKRARP